MLLMTLRRVVVLHSSGGIVVTPAVAAASDEACWAGPICEQTSGFDVSGNIGNMQVFGAAAINKHYRSTVLFM